MAATFLTPRFKNSQKLFSPVQREKVLRFLRSKLNLIQTGCTKKSGKGNDDYYEFLNDEESECDITENLDEIDAYVLSRPNTVQFDINKVMEYWNETDGKLQTFAKGLLACPASSVSVESLFSSCSFVMNKQRNSIAPEKLSDCQIIRSNKDLI